MRTRAKIVAHLFVSVFFCLTTVSTFSSFFRASNKRCSRTDQATGTPILAKMKRKQYNEYRQKLSTYISRKDFSSFATVGKVALSKGFPLLKFEELTRETGEDSLKRAVQATKAMAKRCPNLGLSIPDLFEIANYIETKMPEERQTGRSYFSRKSTNLARSLQVDPQNGFIYIHLMQHGVCGIGEGARKKVTRSILYSPKNPEMVAHCHSSYQIDSEIQAVKDLKGLPGLYDVKSVLERQCKDGRVVHSMMTKYYSGGDLRDYVEKSHRRIPLRQKLQFAHDILVGIESMHKNGYAHRDLGLRNYFVDFVGKGKKKKPVALVGDLGRAAKWGQTNERGAQGGFSQLAPEGIAYDKLAGDDYFYTDIFALGCAFYRLLHGGKAPWIDADSMDDQRIAVDKRISSAKRYIQKFWKVRAVTHSSTKKKVRLPSPVVDFEKMIQKMCDPEPKNRGTAHEIRLMLEKIMRKHKRELARDRVFSKSRKSRV